MFGQWFAHCRTEAEAKGTNRGHHVWLQCPRQGTVSSMVSSSRSKGGGKRAVIGAMSDARNR